MSLRTYAMPILFLVTYLAHGESRPLLFVTIPPQRWLVQQLAGEAVDVRVVVAPGQNPHTYEPSGRQLALLAQAQGWLTIGLPFERTLIAKVRSMQPSLIEYPIHKGIARLSETMSPPHRHAPGEACSEDGTDPHIWLTPANMAHLGTNTCLALKHVLPGKVVELDAALTRLTDDSVALQRTLAETLRPVRGRSFWVYHPSWSYLAQTFDLVQRAVEADGREPTPRQLAALIQSAQAARVRVLFADPQVDPRPIRALATQIGAAVVVLDPLAENWDANMRHVAGALLDAIKD